MKRFLNNLSHPYVDKKIHEQYKFGQQHVRDLDPRVGYGRTNKLFLIFNNDLSLDFFKADITSTNSKSIGVRSLYFDYSIVHMRK